MMTKVLTVTLAGFRYNIFTENGRFAAAIPTSKRAMKAALRVQPDGKFLPADPHEPTSRRLILSCAFLSIALEQSETVEQLVKAIGGMTEHCAICGALLTDSLSVARGVGPECTKKVWAIGTTRRVVDQRLKG
jgi:hypothetical protein